MPRKTTWTLVWRAHLFVECKAAQQRGDVERVQSGHVVRKGHADVLRRIVARGARARAAHRERHRLSVQSVFAFEHPIAARGRRTGVSCTRCAWMSSPSGA